MFKMQDTNPYIQQQIIIAVKSTYEPDFSKPDLPSFIYSYHISITNKNHFPVKLLTREWIVTDSNGEVTVVKGEGVVGLTPIIQTGKNFEYNSNVSLKSGIGRMRGKYTFMNTETRDLFDVAIPEFALEAQFVLN